MSTTSIVEEDNSENTGDEQQDIDAVQHRAKTQVTKHGRFHIRTFSDSPVLNGRQMHWNVIAKDCNSSVIHKLVTECKPDGMRVDYASDRDAGGMCLVVLTGTEEEVKEELDKCNSVLPDDIIVESDSMIKLPDERENEDENQSLLESDSPTAFFGLDLWGLDRIDDRADGDDDYSPPQTGKDMHVFVADTGIRTTHTDFGGRAFPALDVAGERKFIVCDTEDISCAADRHGHGTHCAATVGGQTFGVAKDATLHAVKVLDDDGRCYWSWVLEALDWVKQQQHLRPAIVSASIQGRGIHRVLAAAIDDVTNNGVMVVVAAGNYNEDACGFTPAFAPSAITVGSMQSGDGRSRFSNYGSCLDIFAPGSAILSASHRTDTRRTRMSGTSMAAPHVSGAAALLWEENPTRTVNGVRDLLLARATPEEVHDARSPNLLLYVGPPTGYMGCFRDDWWRDLKGGPQQHGYTVARCRDYALQENMKYFSLQHNGQCFTDNTYSTPAWNYVKRPDSDCGGPCSGETARDIVLKCGGRWRNAVFRTDLIAN